LGSVLEHREGLYYSERTAAREVAGTASTSPVAPLTQASFLPSLVEPDPYTLKRLEVNTTHYILLVYVVPFMWFLILLDCFLAYLVSFLANMSARRAHT
jgi:hypothetical protein